MSFQKAPWQGVLSSSVISLPHLAADSFKEQTKETNSENRKDDLIEANEGLCESHTGHIMQTFCPLGLGWDVQMCLSEIYLEGL